MIKSMHLPKFRLIAAVMICAAAMLMTASGVSYALPEGTKMRGVWVATLANLDYPTKPTTNPQALMSQADKILDQAAAANFNAVFLQVRPDSDALYKSEIFPWSRYLTGKQGVAPDNDFDPLAYWVEAAHKRGIELHAWINPYRVSAKGDEQWGEITPSHPAKTFLAKFVKRYKKKSIHFDPAEPEVRDVIIRGAVEIAQNYDVDGIHMDDYFYPGVDFDDADSYAKYGAGYGNRADWRRANVNTLISEMHDALKSVRPDISFGISPSGIWANQKSKARGSKTLGLEHYINHSADSLTWISRGWIDYIAPQIYWHIGHDKADYAELVNWWSNAVQNSNVKLYIGMGDYRSTNVKDPKSPWYGVNELKRQFAINDGNPNVDGEIHYRYGSIVSDPSMLQLYRTTIR